MTSDAILKALDHVNIEHLDAAYASMSPPSSETATTAAASSRAIANRRSQFRFAYIAAALLILVTIPITIIIANHAGLLPPPIPTTTTEETTAYRPLTNLPGAVPINPENGIAKIEPPGDILSVQDKILQMNNSKKRSFFVGTATYVDSITISDGDQHWTIMAFDVTVEKAIRNITEGETVRILSICYFTDDDKFNGYLRDYFPDKGLMLLENPYAFFSTLPTIIPSYPPPPQINGEIIDLSPYADFCDSGIYETDGDGFYFFSSRIDFSEIQPKQAE